MRPGLNAHWGYLQHGPIFPHDADAQYQTLEKLRKPVITTLSREADIQRYEDEISGLKKLTKKRDEKTLRKAAINPSNEVLFKTNIVAG
jgi:hypothetical protein